MGPLEAARRAARAKKARLLDLIDLLTIMSQEEEATLDTIKDRIRAGITLRHAERVYQDMVETAAGLGFKVERVEDVKDEKWKITVDDPVGLWDATQAEFEKIESELPSSGFRPTAKKKERSVSTADAAEQFGTFDHTIHLWAKLGAPHTTRRVGGQPHFFWDIEELEDWLVWALKKRVVKLDPRVGRMPIEKARERLRHVRDRLNLSRAEFADLLGVSASTLSGWLHEHYHGTHTTVPLAIVAKAEALLQTQKPRLSRLTKVTLDEVEKALGKAGGVKEEAARILQIDSGSLRRLMVKHDMPGAKMVEIVARISRQDIRDAMREAGDSVKKASALLGIAMSSLARVIADYGMEDEFSLRTRPPRVECDDLRAARGPSWSSDREPSRRSWSRSARSSRRRTIATRLKAGE